MISLLHWSLPHYSSFKRNFPSIVMVMIVLILLSCFAMICNSVELQKSREIFSQTIMWGLSWFLSTAINIFHSLSSKTVFYLRCHNIMLNWFILCNAMGILTVLIVLSIRKSQFWISFILKIQKCQFEIPFRIQWLNGRFFWLEKLLMEIEKYFLIQFLCHCNNVILNGLFIGFNFLL